VLSARDNLAIMGTIRLLSVGWMSSRNDNRKTECRFRATAGEEGGLCGKLQAKKNLLIKAGFFELVGERGLRASSMLALRAVAKATWSRCARLKPPSEVLILINYRRKKTCL